MRMLESLIASSTHAVVWGESVTFHPERVALDCTLSVETEIYNAVLLRLSGKVCPNLEDVQTETAIYQTSGGILYSLSTERDRP